MATTFISKEDLLLVCRTAMVLSSWNSCKPHLYMYDITHFTFYICYTKEQLFLQTYLMFVRQKMYPLLSQPGKQCSVLIGTLMYHPRKWAGTKPSILSWSGKKPMLQRATGWTRASIVYSVTKYQKTKRWRPMQGRTRFVVRMCFWNTAYFDILSVKSNSFSSCLFIDVALWPVLRCWNQIRVGWWGQTPQRRARPGFIDEL